MLKTSKKILSVLMVIVLVLTAVPLSSFVGIELPAFDLGVRASALAESGQCGDNVYWSYDNATGELVISGFGGMHEYYYEGGSSPFHSNSIKSVIIEDGVTSIDWQAFENCTNLTNVIIGKNLKTIGYDAFRGCKNITELTLGLEEIPSNYIENHFSDSKINKVTLLEGVEVINDRAFADCTYLETINFPNSLKYMGSDILQNTAWFNYKGKGLVVQDNWLYGYKGDVPAGYTLTIGNDVKNVAAGLLKGLINTNLVAFEVSSDSKYLSTENGVLYNKDKTVIISYPCGKEDKTYTIPNSVVEIYGYAFLDHQLEDIYISSMENWCKINFHNASANPLSEYNTDLYVDGVKSSLLVIPDTITEIKPYAFYYSDQFKDIILHNGVTTIGKDAFYNMFNSDSITFGNGISEISLGFYSFEVQEVYYPGSQEEWDAIEKGGKHKFNYTNLYLMHTHEYTKTVIREPSCTSNGEILYTCIHGDTITEIISTSGHNWVDLGGSVKVTCTTNGINNYRCSNCGEENKGTTSALNHNWEYLENTYATCDKDGYMSRVCLREGCGLKEEEIIPGSHDNYWNIIKAATCTTVGEQEKCCYRCGMTFEKEIIPAKGHNYPENWTILMNATCTDRGLSVKICKNLLCSSVVSQILPKLDHFDGDGNGVCDTCENTDKPGTPDAPAEPDTPDEPVVPEVKPCDCNCHKGGIMGMLFKLILIFQKFFRMNKTCDCGVDHY